MSECGLDVVGFLLLAITFLSSLGSFLFVGLLSVPSLVHEVSLCLRVVATPHRDDGKFMLPSSQGPEVQR
jgi:hypothetical protein